MVGRPGINVSWYRQQPMILLLDHGVTFAGACFQARSMENRDVAARIADDPDLRELQSALGDPFAAHAQYVGNRFLRRDEFVALQTIH